MGSIIVLETPGVYGLKPWFQTQLRPLVRILERIGVRANQVTVFTCAFSVAFGLFLTASIESHRLFLCLPVVQFIRMTLNASDGMLAREFSQTTALGVYLNELADVVSDAFLCLPFAYLPGFSASWMATVIVLALISEMAGVVSVMAGASRRYDGPMGKSDRALVFGALGLWVGVAGALPPLFLQLFPEIMAVLLALTVMNRVRQGLRETSCPRRMYGQTPTEKDHATL
jgi:CDP-diacylglycerol--glycerol-3-phosphate 3-phosphatidyltransferase